MGLFSFIGDTVGGVAKGVAGLGKLVASPFSDSIHAKDALRDIAGGIGAAAPFIPGVGWGVRAGLGALGTLGGGGSVADAIVRGGLGGLGFGGAKGLVSSGLERLGGLGGVGKIAGVTGLLGGGGGGGGGADDAGNYYDAAGQLMTGGGGGAGGGGILGGIGGALGGVRDFFGGGPQTLAAGLTALSLLDQRRQRQAQQQFQQQQMDMLMAALAKGESAYDERAPLRDAAIQGMLSGLGPGFLNSQLAA